MAHTRDLQKTFFFYEISGLAELMELFLTLTSPSCSTIHKMNTQLAED